MLAGRLGREKCGAGTGAFDPDGAVHDAPLAFYRVVERAERVHCDDMRVGHYLVDPVDRRKRHVDRLEPPHPFVARLVQHVFGKEILDRTVVAATR